MLKYNNPFPDLKIKLFIKETNAILDLESMVGIAQWDDQCFFEDYSFELCYLEFDRETTEYNVWLD